jgi:hypothetical protein
MQATTEEDIFCWVCPEAISRGPTGQASNIGNLDRSIPARELHVAFEIPYVYDYITKLCRTQAEVILNHVNPDVHGTGQGEARQRK